MAVVLILAGVTALAFLVWGDHEDWPENWATALGWAGFFALTAGMLILRT